jgi:hypothetical protein
VAEPAIIPGARSLGRWEAAVMPTASADGSGASFHSLWRGGSKSRTGKRSSSRLWMRNERCFGAFGGPAPQEKRERERTAVPAPTRTLSLGPFAAWKNNRIGQWGAPSPVSPELDSAPSAWSEANESLFDLLPQRSKHPTLSHPCVWDLLNLLLRNPPICVGKRECLSLADAHGA